MKQKHGGPRQNSGRPLKGAEKMTQRTITMEPSTWAKLDQLAAHHEMKRGEYLTESIVADWYLSGLDPNPTPKQIKSWLNPK